MQPLDLTSSSLLLTELSPSELSLLSIFDDSDQVAADTSYTEIKEPLQHIMGPYLDSNRIGNLMGVCRSFHAIFTPNKLLLDVVQGKENEVKNRLESEPTLLLNTNAAVTDYYYSNRVIKEVTPFQAALCAGDIEMCKMMKPYFQKLEGGIAEFERQYRQIFPHGSIVQMEQQQNDVFDFMPIIDAIKNASKDQVENALHNQFEQNTLYETDTPLDQALYEFRAKFHQKSLSEKIYNPYHLLCAFKRYDSEFPKTTTPEMRDLFLRQVIGFVQRYLPACYAQAFATGLSEIGNGSISLERSFTFKDHKGSYYPGVKSHDLGYGSAIYFSGFCKTLRRHQFQFFGPQECTGCEKITEAFSNVVSRKNYELSRLII